MKTRKPKLVQIGFAMASQKTGAPHFTDMMCNVGDMPILQVYVSEQCAHADAWDRGRWNYKLVPVFVPAGTVKARRPPKPVRK